MNTNFLKYAFNDWFSKGIVIVSLIFLVVGFTLLIRDDDADTLLIILAFPLTPMWVVFWIKSWQGYKKYQSFQKPYKHNEYSDD